MKRASLLISLLTVSLSMHPARANAQYAVPYGTVSAGGGIRSGSNIIYDTAGQGAACGAISGGSWQVKTGFWYIADLSSTVDVAIASFTGIYDEDAVTLSWTFSETFRCDGSFVYRAEEGDDVFVRLNAESLPGTASGYRDETAIPGRTYRYRIGVIENGGEHHSIDISVTLPPKPLTLYQNYPNPFNPSTAIAYFLPEDCRVRLSIFDTAGRLVRTLADGPAVAGTHTIGWDGRNDRGSSVGSGVYYYRLTAGRKTITRKLVLMR